jgi:hypothetical protein
MTRCNVINLWQLLEHQRWEKVISGLEGKEWSLWQARKDAAVSVQVIIHLLTYV